MDDKTYKLGQSMIDEREDRPSAATKINFSHFPEGTHAPVSNSIQSLRARST